MTELTCPFCGYFPCYPSGAVSDGDGCIYDEAACDVCEETFVVPGSETWIDDAGDSYRSQEDWLTLGYFEGN